MHLTRHKTLWLSLVAACSLAAIAIYRRPWRRPAVRTRSREDPSHVATWRFGQQFTLLPAGKVLRVETSSPALVHWTVDQWDTVRDTRTQEIERGVHIADLPTGNLPMGKRIQFTLYWPEVNRWEGEDFELTVSYATQHAG